MTESLNFTAYGKPRPKGSKRHVGNGVMIEASKGLPTWNDNVRSAARAEIELRQWESITEGPVRVELLFFFDPPKAKHGTRPCNRGTPDVDKLARAVLDCLTDAGVFKDDSQVSSLNTVKRWSFDSLEGCAVHVRSVG